MSQYIAVDLGAESGRVMLGTVNPDELHVHEIHRFANQPIREQDTLRWNFRELLAEVKTGISKAIAQADGETSSIGVDSWGIDFGLLDRNDQLIEDPYHYRDSRTDGVMEQAFALMPKRDIYQSTGVQFMQINTLYQLLSIRLNDSPALARAKKLIFIADLVSFFLTGRAYADYTIASTSQLMDMSSGQWSGPIFNKLDLPLEIMPEVVAPGTIVGRLDPEICKQLACKPLKVIAPGSHDTAVAVAAVPAQTDSWAYISSGTWSLMGIETPRAIINDQSFAHGFTNEGGVENTIRFLKNIMGLWLIQQCKRQWRREGHDFSYSQITSLAAEAKPFHAHLDPDCGEFLAPGDMPRKINQYLADTGQLQTDDPGQIARIVFESLALKYRSVIDAIQDITRKPIEVLHIVGGGTQNELLCQFAADATGKTVFAGPAEATACGNVLIQALACGQIESLAKARKLLRNSFELEQYQPQDAELWSSQYEKFRAL